MVVITNSLPLIWKETTNVFNISVIDIYCTCMFRAATFSAAVIQSTENAIIDKQKNFS